MRLWHIIGACTLMVYFGCETVVWAQGSAATTVTGRPRASDQVGLPVGSFVVYPSLDVGYAYDDNIFATENNEKDDHIFTVTPTVAIESDWNNHAFGLQSSATIFRYADNTDEDVEDYGVATNGRIDILRSTALNLGAGFQHAHEDRGSADDAQGKEPTEFDTFGGQAVLSHRFSALWSDVGATLKYLDYDDVSAAGGGSINNDDRDRLETEAFLTVGYDFHPDASAFVRGSFDIETYDHTPDDNGFDRDSKGFAFVAGSNFDLTGVTFGEVFAGIMHRNNDDSAFDDDDLSYTLGANVDWNVTQLTTVHLEAARSFEETTVDNSSSTLTTDAAISVDHELLRSLLLNAGFSYTLDDFQDISRDDDTIRATFGATYLLNRYVHLLGGYSFRQRWSDAAGEDYSENIISFNIRLQY